MKLQARAALDGAGRGSMIAASLALLAACGARGAPSPPPTVAALPSPAPTVCSNGAFKEEEPIFCYLSPNTDACCEAIKFLGGCEAGGAFAAGGAHVGFCRASCGYCVGDWVSTPPKTISAPPRAAASRDPRDRTNEAPRAGARTAR